MQPSSADHSGAAKPAADPSRRDPFIDVLRVAAITVVVVGHWATTTIVWEPDRVSSVNALEVIPETRLATWVVQVMPLVFFAGGFANAMMMARSRASFGYLRVRMQRLLAPTVVFLVVWGVIGIVIEATDPTAPGKIRAAETAALPMWFLGIYVVVVAAAPLMWRLHRRFGWRVPLGLAGAIALVDVIALGVGLEDVGGLNYALVWLLAHQAGFFYADGTLQQWGPRVTGMVAGAGLGALVLLTTVGGYAVSLVGVPGGIRDNAEPPTLAMVAATVWLVGLVLLLRPMVLRRLERRSRRREVVGRLHGLLLTAYLWHITALMVSAGAWRASGLPEPAIGSGQWWALRPLWVLAAMPPLLVLLAALRRFEIHPAPAAPPAPPATPIGAIAAVLGVFAVAVGLLGFGETGFLPLAPEQGEAILLFDFNPLQNVLHLLLGGAILAAAGSPRWRAVAAYGGGAAFVAIGLGHQAGMLDRLGMNGPSAAAHVVAGGAVIAATVLVPLLSRRAGRPPAV